MFANEFMDIDGMYMYVWYVCHRIYMDIYGLILLQNCFFLGQVSITAISVPRVDQHIMHGAS